ncbi:MAG: hypothetical protein RIG77_05095 [Cyclobacteriaceae bacterium]
MRYIFLFLLNTAAVLTFGQTTTNPKAVTSMDKGYEAMLDGKYEEADELLRYAMKNIGKLPSELTYYFGRNSFYLKKYKQSINWLNKYVELKGTSGQYFDESIKFLELANKEYLLIRDKEIAKTEEIFETESYIECPGEKVLCPVCKGTGVVITKGTFDLKYETCVYSGIEGILTCDEYNLYLKGQLKPKTTE